MIQLGPYTLDNRLVLAPMAGVTDRPFRIMCKQLGAAMAVSEMITSDKRLWKTAKSSLRMNYDGEPGIRSVQIAGGDPEMMAEAAKLSAERGAQIVDINMGCPAKKVCNKAAGSALLKDEGLVKEILDAVIESVDIPVTLKTRIGWSQAHHNGIRVAHLAQDAGITAIAIHGRTRECKYHGPVNYEAIKQIKSEVSIPVFANGDIDSPEKALQVLEYTQADGLLIGRAAQGRPWIFNEINHYLETGEKLKAPTATEIQTLLLSHLRALYEFYGDFMGVRIARKHVGWYLQTQPTHEIFKKDFNRLESCQEQLAAIQTFFHQLIRTGSIAA
ncbi:tRNA dihydrouridine synthase DusB [Litoribacillus peritrichatus]|uniref:tRNA-dihydrouridine synthase B n=1 Tax=Litoribacillus peritrichatus TaxID=718191 RepID=A0ABP7MWL8_9GAMM